MKKILLVLAFVLNSTAYADATCDGRNIFQSTLRMGEQGTYLNYDGTPADFTISGWMNNQNVSLNFKTKNGQKQIVGQMGSQMVSLRVNTQMAINGEITTRVGGLLGLVGMGSFTILEKKDSVRITGSTHQTRGLVRLTLKDNQLQGTLFRGNISLAFNEEGDQASGWWNAFFKSSELVSLSFKQCLETRAQNLILLTLYLMNAPYSIN